MENNYYLRLSLDESRAALSSLPANKQNVSATVAGKPPLTESAPDSTTPSSEREKDIVKPYAAEQSDLASELNTASRMIDNLLVGLKVNDDEPAGTSKPDPVLSQLLDEILDLQQESLYRNSTQETGYCFDTPPASNEATDVNRKDILALALEDIGLISDSPETEEESLKVDSGKATESQENECSVALEPPKINQCVALETQKTCEVDQQSSLPAAKVPRKRGRPPKPQSERKSRKRKAAVANENNNVTQITEPAKQPQNIEAANQMQILNQSISLENNLQNSNCNLQAELQSNMSNQMAQPYSNNLQQLAQYPNHLNMGNQLLSMQNMNALGQFQPYTQIANPAATNCLVQQTQFLNIPNEAQPSIDSQRHPSYYTRNTLRPLPASTPYAYPNAMHQPFVDTAIGRYQQPGPPCYSTGMQGYTHFQTGIPNPVHQQVMCAQNQNFQQQQAYQPYSHNGYALPQQFAYNTPPTPTASPQLLYEYNNQPQQSCYSVPPQNLQPPLQDPVVRSMRGRQRRVSAVESVQQQQPNQTNMQQPYYAGGVSNLGPCNWGNGYPVFQQPPSNYNGTYPTPNIWDGIQM